MVPDVLIRLFVYLPAGICLPKIAILKNIEAPNKIKLKPAILTTAGSFFLGHPANHQAVINGDITNMKSSISKTLVISKDM